MTPDKRAFLLAALGLAIPSAGQALPVRRDLQCTPFDGWGWRTCEVGIPLYSLPSAQQRCQNWCWAACVEAIFSFSGYYIPQEVLVQRVSGALVCRPGNAGDVETLTNGRWVDSSGRRFQAATRTILDVQRARWSPFIIEEVAQALAARVPVMAFIGPASGAVGHAVVITALTYVQNVQGQYTVRAITVRDPWPGSPNRRILGGDELRRLQYLAAVQVGPSW